MEGEIIFFGDAPNQEYSFLSNYYLSPVKVYTYEFKCVEIAMQWYKCILFAEDDTYNVHLALQIIRNVLPHTACIIGKEIRGFSKDRWEIDSTCHFLEELLLQKMKEYPAIGEALMNTGDSELVYVSSDPFWGIGMDEDDTRFVCRELWGKNNLGRVLKSVRKTMRSVTYDYDMTEMNKVLDDIKESKIIP
ncbi:MAG: hypothetical protein JWR43_2818 [Phenylobacterium sp.]|jgi:ribA/ribD-fused uncharacterized protein|nr:hypothetical protein [Phenylobacterium sp.]